MRFFCESHNAVHTFTRGQTKALVYTLQGMVYDREAETRDPATPRPTTPCLIDVWELSQSIEGYAEWTGEMLAAAKAVKPMTNTNWRTEAEERAIEEEFAAPYDPAAFATDKPPRRPRQSPTQAPLQEGATDE